MARRLGVAIATALLCFLALDLPAQLVAAEPAQSGTAINAEQRLALVIGNNAYKDAPLKNPVNDARAMATTLRQLGFEVIALEDASAKRMQQAILDFGGKLKTGGVGLFYYAGHGVQVRGQNYLVPVDAEIGSEAAVRFEAVAVESITEQMGEAANRVNIVILDACRNNPFERRLRGASRGLAAMDAARGTLVAYATAPGSVALDGDGENGLYTSELLKVLGEPDLKAEEVFKRVRAGVVKHSGGKQTPWESSSLTGDFVFNFTVNVTTPAPSAGFDERQIELAYWNSIKDSAHSDAFRAYLEQYPKGSFATLARLKLAELASKPPPAADVAPRQDQQTMAMPNLVEPAMPTVDGDAMTCAVLRTSASRAAFEEYLHAFPQGQCAGFARMRLTELAPAGSSADHPAVTMLAPPAEPPPRPPPSPTTPAGTVFRDCPECPEMVVVPLGRFLMGSPQGEPGRQDDEGPQHLVIVPQAFAVGRYEVTFAQWDACVAGGGCDGYRPKDQGWGRDRRPVTNVSWHDARHYVEWLARKTGRPYRLLTEAEWEYAARGGTASAYWWGDRNAYNKANCDGCTAKASGRTLPAGSFAPNPFGLYDTAGNVAEWVEDCFTVYTEASAVATVAVTQDTCTNRMLRGNDWSFPRDTSRSAYRRSYMAEERHHTFGLRVGLSLL